MCLCVQYPFCDFYADDHLSTMMLIDNDHKTLDFQYILWRYDTSNLPTDELKRLDKGPGGNYEETEDSDGETPGSDGAGRPEQIKGSSCCTIF